jgi:hypothetical protein
MLNLATSGEFFHSVETYLFRAIHQASRKNSNQVNSSFIDAPFDVSLDEITLLNDIRENYLMSYSEQVTTMRVRMPFFLDIQLRFLYEMHLSFHYKNLYLLIIMDLVKHSTFNASQLGSVFKIFNINK